MLKKIALASLGCSKNLIDSEHMLAVLTDAGYEIVSDEEDADVIIVNTCTFIESAKTESIECILELAQYKKEGNCKALIVAGCLAQRYDKQVLSEIPEVDAVVGVNEYDRIAEVIKQLEGRENGILCCGSTYVNEDGMPRFRLTPSYTAYLKIAEGCDNHCTYCVIPSIRGKYRSRKIEDIVDETKRIVAEGVREIVVIAQDTTRYGIDIYGEYRLPCLLRELCAIDGVDWVRVHYCYPELMTDELIKVFAEEEKLCSYFDIPIQHCSDAVLKRMGRHTNKAQITEIIEKIRREVKDAVIRTTIIVGFPGETEEQFEELCDFVRDTKFDRLGVFAYSREEDTPAYNFDGQIDEDEKERRRDVLMLIQSEIAEELAARKVGTVVRVLVEDRDEVIKSWYGRTYADSEEIDGKVFFKSSGDLKSGDFVDVLIEQSMEYDLFGRENV